MPPASPSRHAELLLLWNGRSRAVALNRWTLVGLAVVIPCLTIALFAATAYLACHDDLLAAMMTRQAEMQYSYEDRIASLQTQLDQQTMSGNAERGSLDTRLRRLDERRDQLESRTVAIDGLVARLLTGITKRSSSIPAAPGTHPDVEPFPRASGALRLEQDRPAGDQHVELSSKSVARAVGLEQAFDRLAQHQAAQLAGLAGPTLRGVERMNAALAMTGLPLGRWHVDRGVGGPFVPLDPTTVGFDGTLVLLRDAAIQVDRLGAIVDSVPLRQPLAGPLEVTSMFGARLDPFFGRPAMHTGLDLGQAWGESVTATAGGVVTSAGQDGGYGQMVEIDHGNGVRTRYAHLGFIAVGVNQKVAVGAVVGQVGSTGRATGPHLHYEVRIDGEPVDPARFLKAGATLSGAE